jgi:hypothetical protein
VRGRLSKSVWALVAVACSMAGAMAVSSCGSTMSHPGGDPGARLMADLAPTASVVPGFEQKVPWISPPCDSCRWPDTYALKIEPHWDSCYGIASTAGWDPAIIQIGLKGTVPSRDLVAAIGSRLSAKGWYVGASPSWSEDQGAFMTWDFPRGQAASKTLALDSPIDGLGWMVVIEAKPMGQLVDCSRQRTP